LTLFHGFYEEYQYLPLLITCANNDLVVMASLRHGTAHAALGADDDLEYLVQRLRAVWPAVPIVVDAVDLRWAKGGIVRRGTGTARASTGARSARLSRHPQARL
jgi:hypothetical protein